MPHYMLAAHTRQEDTAPALTDEEMKASWQRIQRVEADLKSADAWVFSARLHDPDTATVVRVSNGDVLTTDGPFAESKDHLGGFYVIEAADLDAALAWAARVSEAIGNPIEVRPFAGVAWEPGG
ncbi:MAG TPA: YciI family protein [Candidatus Acidoferrum sp.]|nr:YciI family protein [Candidatus Acidoferrum sp.]